MVSEEEDNIMCRAKAVVCHWQPGGKQQHHQLQPQWTQQRGGSKKWHKAVRGRQQQQIPGASRGRKRGQRSHQHQHPYSHHHHHHHHHHHQQQQQQQPRHLHSGGGPSGWSLRPFNVKGNRAARGMCAPKNTNQFLMHEKYQLMKMRSDSLGTDSGSDGELEQLTDMDSYLRVLENARGALPDDNSGMEHGYSPSRWSPRPCRGPVRVFAVPVVATNILSLKEAWRPHQEDSMQYFPSEDDVLQSEQFMQRDFNEFCDTLTDDYAA